MVIVSPGRKRQETTGDRWEKFEADFGIANPDSSLVKNSIQNAKYKLDQTTFALQEFVDNVVDTLRFDYSVRDLVTGSASAKSNWGSSGSAVMDTLSGARFKSEVDLKLSGRQFVGVKLVLPLGD